MTSVPGAGGRAGSPEDASAEAPLQSAPIRMAMTGSLIIVMTKHGHDGFYSD